MLQRLTHPFISYSLVGIQFFCIALLLWFAPWLSNGFGLLLQLLAILLGLWAIATMHLGHFNIVPDPMPDANLVTQGPYRWIRHPMYASLLLFFLPIALQSQHLSVWLIYALLLIDLLLKLHYEESLLKQVFKEYPRYQSISKKLIPYLF